MIESPAREEEGRARPLHCAGSVAPLAALLTLSLPALAAAGGVDLTESIERIPLPAGLSVSVGVEPLASRVTLQAADPASLARRVRAGSHALCPEVAQEGEKVVLRCATREIAAAMVSFSGGQFLELRQLQVPPWTGRDGLPIVPFDPHKLELGSHCPGDGNAAVGECSLAAGHWELADQSFREALGGPHGDLAALRLGDLAAHAGNLKEAVAQWRRVSPSSQFGRLAGVRLCEVDPRCLSSNRATYLFVPGETPSPLREDLVLRQARMDAFRGRALEAAQALASEYGPAGACTAEPLLCADILIAALREPGERGVQALSLYLEVPSRDRGPAAVTLARAASDQAATNGAPVFAANLLANVSGEVPAGLLSDHLARASELYLQGDDRVRAGVLLDFARSRLSKSELASPRWARIARGLSARAVPSAPERKAVDTSGAEEDLQAARKALAAVPPRPRGGTP